MAEPEAIGVRRRRRGSRQAAIFVMATCAAVGPLSASRAGEITDLIPADCLVAYAATPYEWLAGESRPAPGGTDQPPNPVLSITTIVSFLHAAGMIPQEGQVFADVASSLPLLGRFEHALALLDVSCRVVQFDGSGPANSPNQKSLRLDGLQAAAIFRVNDEPGAVEKILDHLVSRYTNSDVAAVSRHEARGQPYFRLTDARIAEWAVWEWGRLDEYYVVAFGRGAFEKIAETWKNPAGSISRDAWFRLAMERTHGDRAWSRLFIAITQLRRALGEVASGRVASVLSALGADDMTCDFWTIGQEGRALTWRRSFRRAGEDVTCVYSDESTAVDGHESIIPSQANRYAVIDVPTKWLVDNLPRAWLESQSPRNVEKWQMIWRNLEKETGVDISRKLIDNFGDQIVIFDYPPHPLRIPFALTIAIEITDRRAVQLATDSLLDAWSRYLDERAERKKTELVRVKVRRDADGVWYLQAGILGPALKVTDHYVVLSWSPQALRDALKVFEPLEEKAAKGP
jgi:hypothetical protein